MFYFVFQFATKGYQCLPVSCKSRHLALDWAAGSVNPSCGARALVDAGLSWQLGMTRVAHDQLDSVNLSKPTAS
jgi:hypothetical protein